MTTELKIPEGYQTVMPYLILKDAAAFIGFTKKVFNATEKMRHMRDETIIMHAEIVIGGSTIMFADATELYTIINEPSNQSYGRSGIIDPFGNNRWITSII